MKLFISPFKITVPKHAQLIITDYPFMAIKNAIEDKIKKKDITLIATNNSLFVYARTARYHQVKLQLGSKKVSLGNTALAKSLFILNLASRKEDIKLEKQKTLKACVNSLSRMSFETLEKIIKDKLSTTSNQFIIELKIHLEKIKAEAIKSVSISPNNKKVKFVNVDYKDDLTHLVTMPGIHLFVGDRGTGKSELLMKMFKETYVNKRYPIYMSASRALTEQLIGNDIRHYKHAYSEPLARAALGVILKLLLDDNYDELRAKSETLFIDEIEDVIDLSTSSIVGNGKLSDRKLLLQRWEEQILKSKSVIAADAFTSEYTVDWLYKLAKKCGKNIYVYPQESSFKKSKVKVMSYATNLAISRCSAISGDKFGCYSDGQHNKDKSIFDAEVLSINGIKKENPKDKQEYIADHIQIDAGFSHSRSEQSLSDISKLADDKQIVFYNPALKNGVSILNPDYKLVSLLAHGTSAPNDLIQADNRFRFRDEIWLSFKKPERNLCTNPISILVNLVNKEFSDDLTQEMLHDMLNDVYLKRIASRIAFKNKMRQHYELTVLTIYKHLGHDIEFINNTDADKEGKQRLLESTEEEEKIRDKEIMDAEKIVYIEANIIREMGAHASKQFKRQLKNYELRKFYHVSEVTPELLRFANKRNELILQMLLLAEIPDQGLSIEEQLKQQLIKRFLDVVKLHDGEFRYNNIDAKELHDLLVDGVITVGCQSHSAKKIFIDTFKLASLSKINVISTVNSVLEKEFGIKPTPAKKKAGNRAYTANLSCEMKMWLEHIKREKSLLSNPLVA